MRVGVTEPVTVEEIARGTGQTVREVRRGLKEAEAAGFIEAAGDDRWYLTVPVEDPRGTP